MRYSSIASGAATAGRWSVIALGLSIPISVALDNLLLLAVALAWLAAGNYRETLTVIRENPVAQAALVLFGLLALGLAYGSRNPGDGLHYLAKYIDLLFVPLFLVFFRDAKTRERALLTFSMAAVASVIASHMAFMNILATGSLLPREQIYATGFKGSITHSLIVAFAAYLFALLARQDRNRMRRIGCIALALFAAHNVVFMGFGRTGYLVLAILFLYFFAVTLGRRGLIMIAVIAITTFSTAYVTSSTFHQRMNDFSQQLMEWKPGKRSETSVGLRLEWYTASLGIIRAHPLIGAGTGSFPAEYARAVADRDMVATENPHNEYLLIAVQIGLLGVASLVYLFYRQWRAAGQLEQPLFRDLARGLVLMFVVGCLFNSLLVDHTEGLLFAWMSALVFAAPVRQQPSTEGVP
jgi:O-antigen ligase